MTYFFRFHFFNNSLYIGCTSQIPYFYSYVILFYFSERVGGGGGCHVTLALQPTYFRRSTYGNMAYSASGTTYLNSIYLFLYAFFFRLSCPMYLSAILMLQD